MEVISLKSAFFDLLDSKVGMKHHFRACGFGQYSYKLIIFSKLAPAFNKRGAR
jgi:hypothetical protein